MAKLNQRVGDFKGSSLERNFAAGTVLSHLTVSPPTRVWVFQDGNYNTGSLVFPSAVGLTASDTQPHETYFMDVHLV